MFLSLFALYFFIKLVALPAFPRETTRCVAPQRDEPGRIQGRKSSDYEPACSRRFSDVRWFTRLKKSK